MTQRVLSRLGRLETRQATAVPLFACLIDGQEMALTSLDFAYLCEIAGHAGTKGERCGVITYEAPRKVDFKALDEAFEHMTAG